MLREPLAWELSRQVATMPHESLNRPSECDEDVRELQNRVRSRVERCPVPSSGYIIDFPSVYGCDVLASRIISHASQVCAIADGPKIRLF